MSDSYDGESHQNCYHCWVSEEETGTFNQHSKLFGNEAICDSCADIEVDIDMLTHLYHSIRTDSKFTTEDLDGLKIQIQDKLEELNIDSGILTTDQVLTQK